MRWKLRCTPMHHYLVSVWVPSDPMMKWWISGPVDILGTWQLFWITPLGDTIVTCTNYKIRSHVVGLRTKPTKSNYRITTHVMGYTAPSAFIFMVMCTTNEGRFIQVLYQASLTGSHKLKNSGWYLPNLQCSRIHFSSCPKPWWRPSLRVNWTPWNRARGPCIILFLPTTSTEKRSNLTKRGRL